MKRLLTLFVLCLVITNAYSRDYARELAVDLSWKYQYFLSHTAPATKEHGIIYVLQMPTSNVRTNGLTIKEYLTTKACYLYCYPFHYYNDIGMVGGRIAVWGTSNHITIYFVGNTVSICDVYKYKCKHGRL